MKILNKSGKTKADINKADFPLYHKVETIQGIKWYKTIMTKQQKICTTAATEQDILLITYLSENENTTQKKLE